MDRTARLHSCGRCDDRGLGSQGGGARPAIVGLAVQGAVTVGLYVVAGLWAPDAVVYDQIGQFAAYWGGGPAPSVVAEGKEAFPLMLGAVYRVVGQAPSIGLAMNWAATDSLSQWRSWRGARFAGRPQRGSSPLPRLPLWSALLLRETITWLLMAPSCMPWSAWLGGSTVGDLAILIAALAALMWFRGTAAIVLAAAGMLALIVTANRRTVGPRIGVAGLALWSWRRDSRQSSPATPPSMTSRKTPDLADTADTRFGPAGAGGTRPGWRGDVLVESAVRVTLGPYPLGVGGSRCPVRAGRSPVARDPGLRPWAGGAHPTAGTAPAGPARPGPRRGPRDHQRELRDDAASSRADLRSADPGRGRRSEYSSSKVEGVANGS